ncbi:MAG: rhomboid family intramembrane serine protease, partial [Thermoleophilaceae bacterium]
KVKSIGRPGDPVVTYVLIGINVAIHLGTVLSGASATSGSLGGSSLLNEGTVSRFAVDDGEYWRILTSGFLHLTFFHLLFNMFALYILGGLLEPTVGRLRFILIYFVSLLAGSFGALLLTSGSTAGASGAVFGMMGAAMVVMRRRGINPLESGLGIWMGLNLLITFTIPGISIGGHLGGLAGGVLVAVLLYELPDRVRMPAIAPMLLAGAVGLAAVIGSIAVAASASPV